MNTSLDVSRHLDRVTVDLLLAVDAAATALGLSYCIVGAFARDVVLGFCFGISTGRATRDIDFGLMLDDWVQFEQLRTKLQQGHGFAAHPRIPHRLTFRGGRELDIVPFGAIEQGAGQIAWPPDFSTVMSTIGLRQAHARAINIVVAPGKSLPFVSPPALALLKLLAWSQRGDAVNNKDAGDLALLMTTYLQAGNESRLYQEHAALLDEQDFDFDAAGARILGRDLAVIAGGEITLQLVQILERGMALSLGEPLLRALPLRYEHAQRMLHAVLKGLQDA